MYGITSKQPNIDPPPLGAEGRSVKVYDDCKNGCMIAEARGGQFACEHECAYATPAAPVSRSPEESGHLEMCYQRAAPDMLSYAEELHAEQEQCSYCHVWYTRPVSLHHDQAECDNNIGAKAMTKSPLALPEKPLAVQMMRRQRDMAQDDRENVVLTYIDALLTHAHQQQARADGMAERLEVARDREMSVALLFLENDKRGIEKWASGIDLTLIKGDTHVNVIAVAEANERSTTLAREVEEAKAIADDWVTKEHFDVIGRAGLPIPIRIARKFDALIEDTMQKLARGEISLSGAAHSDDAGEK